MATLSSLPDELVVGILALVPSRDIAASVQRVCRRFYRLSDEPKMWLARCRADFVYWNAAARARLDAAATGAVSGPWKRMWIARMRDDADTARRFAHVVATKIDRVKHLAAICSRSLDAKDFLLAQSRLGDDGAAVPADEAEHLLTRRHYAMRALGSINRGLAIEEWEVLRLQTHDYTNLDRALGAFDMFVLHDGEEDMDWIEKCFDKMADAFRRCHPDLDSMTVAQKALAVMRWIRMHNLTGMPDADLNYRNIRNCLIGQALSDPEHPSLPVISSAIFACLAQRINLHAYCTAAPEGMYATVLAPRGMSVHGEPLPDGYSQAIYPRPPMRVCRVYADELSGEFSGELSDAPPPPTSISHPNEDPEFDEGSGPAGDLELDEDFEFDEDPEPGVSAASAMPTALPNNGERMFLEPALSANEVPLPKLRDSIAMAGHGGSRTRDDYMLPAATAGLVMSVAAQIHDSWSIINRRSADPAVAAMMKTMRRRGDPDMNLDAMLYGSIWANVMMRPLTGGLGWDDLLTSLLSRITHAYSEDVWIVQRFLVPMYEQHRQMDALGIRNRNGMPDELRQMLQGPPPITGTEMLGGDGEMDDMSEPGEPGEQGERPGPGEPPGPGELPGPYEPLGPGEPPMQFGEFGTLGPLQQLEMDLQMDQVRQVWRDEQARRARQAEQAALDAQDETNARGLEALRQQGENAILPILQDLISRIIVPFRDVRPTPDGLDGNPTPEVQKVQQDAMQGSMQKLGQRGQMLQVMLRLVREHHDGLLQFQAPAQHVQTLAGLQAALGRLQQIAPPQQPAQQPAQQTITFLQMGHLTQTLMGLYQQYGRVLREMAEETPQRRRLLQRQQEEEEERSLGDPAYVLEMMHQLDVEPPMVSRRSTYDVYNKVQYRIGQVFRHRRFGFIGIINGWKADDGTGRYDRDDPDDIDNSHSAMAGVTAAAAAASLSSSSSAPAQPEKEPKVAVYYTCLRPGITQQVIAQKNIEIITDPRAITPSLMYMAGRNFKRFDAETCTFVSNVREFYPDD